MRTRVGELLAHGNRSYASDVERPVVTEHEEAVRVVRVVLSGTATGLRMSAATRVVAIGVCRRARRGAAPDGRMGRGRSGARPRRGRRRCAPWLCLGLHADAARLISVGPGSFVRVLAACALCCPFQASWIVVICALSLGLSAVNYEGLFVREGRSHLGHFFFIRGRTELYQ